MGNAAAGESNNHHLGPKKPCNLSTNSVNSLLLRILLDILNKKTVGFAIYHNLQNLNHNICSLQNSWVEKKNIGSAQSTMSLVWVFVMFYTRKQQNRRLNCFLQSFTSNSPEIAKSTSGFVWK